MARVALKQAELLASEFEIHLLSETFPTHLQPGIRAVELAPRRFDYLRRLCHVPNALAFAAAVKSTLVELRRHSPFDLVIHHDQAVAGIVARGLAMRFAVCAHEDIACRPRGTYGLLHTQLHRWATPHAYREAAAVLAISPHMAERARAYGAAADRITLAPAGLEPIELGLSLNASDESSGRPERTFQLLYVGRLAVEKGVDVLLDACRLLGERGSHYSLDLVGDGVLRSRLERQARALGLSDSVRFVGFVPRDELGSYYKRADLVCMPSLDEPFGAVALEALMSGTPVVASDVGGIPFVVRHGENGLLVPPKQPAALADTLALLDRDRDRLASLRRAAHASVRSRFAWDRVAESTFDAVRRAMTPRPAWSGSATAQRRGQADGA